MKTDGVCKTEGENLTFQIRIFRVLANFGIGQGFVWATTFLRAIKICATNVNLEMSILGFTKFYIFYVSRTL